jgi:hypothetical protein
MKTIIAFLGWVIKKLSKGQAVVVWIDEDLAKNAKAVVVVVDNEIANASPENKHARAFAKLRRLCPGQSKKDIGLAIELALR